MVSHYALTDYKYLIEPHVSKFLHIGIEKLY